MRDERTLELIHRSVDGEVDDAERQELARLLSESAEVREQHDRLEQFVRLMRTLPSHEPPPGLRRQILEQAELPRARRPLFGASGWLAPGRWAAATAAAVVMALGIYVLQLQGPEPFDTGNMSGTMIPATQLEGPALVDRFELSGESLHGTATLSKRGNGLVLDLQLASTEPMALTVDLAAAGLQPLTIEPSAQPATEVSLADGLLRFQSEGKQHFQIVLALPERPDSAGSARIVLDYGVAGQAMQRGELVLHQQKLDD